MCSNLLKVNIYIESNIRRTYSNYLVNVSNKINIGHMHLVKITNMNKVLI